MHFAFTDDQLAFRDAVRELLERECTPTHVRAAWTNDTGRVPGLWEQLRAMGVVDMLLPEARDGLGMTMADLVLILEETGRCALPEPIVETAAFGAELLEGAGPTGELLGKEHVGGLVDQVAGHGDAGSDSATRAERLLGRCHP